MIAIYTGVVVDVNREIWVLSVSTQSRARIWINDQMNLPAGQPPNLQAEIWRCNIPGAAEPKATCVASWQRKDEDSPWQQLIGITTPRTRTVKP